MGYDGFSSPSFESSSFDSGGSSGASYGGFGGYEEEPQGSPLQKFLIPLAALAVLAVIAFFVLPMFLPSPPQTVQFTVNDLEGAEIGKARIDISKDGEVVKRFKGSDSFELPPGEYEYEASASDYEKDSGTFEVIANQDNAVDIKLPKKIDVDLVVEVAESFVLGQKTKGKITFKNNESDNIVIDLVPEGDVSGKEPVLKIEEEFGKSLTIPPGIDYVLEFSIEAADKMPKTKSKSKEGKQFNASFRVKGTKKKVEFSFDLIEFKSSDVKLSKRSVDFGKITANEKDKVDLKITNGNKEVTLENISIELDPESIQSEGNDKDEILNWFSFNPNKIGKLPPKESSEFSFTADLPLTARSGSIEGKAILKNDFWKEELAFELEIEQATYKLEITSSPRSVKVSRGEDEQFIPKSERVTVENKGDLTISNIVLSSNPECSGTWITIIDSSPFNLESKKKQTVSISVSAPDNAPEKITKFCELFAVFTNPLDPLGERENISKDLEVIPE